MIESSYQGSGRYRHYRGEYKVLGLALQEDTVRKLGQPEHDDAGPEVQFVIYRPLTPGSLLEDRVENFWARELQDFNAQVDLEHGRVPRFELMMEKVYPEAP